MYLIFVLPILINANIISDVKNITNEIDEIFVKSMNTASRVADAVEDTQTIPQVIGEVRDIFEEGQDVVSKIKNFVSAEYDLLTIARNIVESFKNVTSLEDLSNTFSKRVQFQHCDGTTEQLDHFEIFEKHQEMDKNLEFEVENLIENEKSENFDFLMVSVGDVEGSIGVRASLQKDATWKIDLIRKNC